MIRTLIIDDEQAMCDRIEGLFTYIGFTVFKASTLKKALDIFEKKKPKIIFLDILMPDIDGVKLLKKFKEMDSQVIVIMVTSKRDIKTQRRASQSGSDGFIVKPFNFDDLRVLVTQNIENLLNQRGYMQKPRILVVDDDQRARDNLREFILPRYDCEWIETKDGHSAIEEARENSPDVILLDINLPGISGIDTIKEIKMICPSVRIIVVSAYKSSHVAIEAMEVGAFQYICKDEDPEVFKDKFELALMTMGRLIKRS